MRTSPRCPSSSRPPTCSCSMTPRRSPLAGTPSSRTSSPPPASTSTTCSPPEPMNPIPIQPREDDGRIAAILGAADEAAHCMTGRSLEEVLATPETRETLRRCATDLGTAALEVSEMMRNWASHIPWESMTALGEGPTPAPDEDGAVRALWGFLHQELPQVRVDLEDMWRPAHLRR